MIQTERVRKLGDGTERGGRYLLYWMQQAQRAHCNHALEFAVRRANELKKPLVVFFGLTPKFPHANANHYRFMLEGLAETAEAVEERGAEFIAQASSPEKGVVALARHAAEVVFDRGYLRIQRQWRDRAARGIGCPVYEVESDAVVPVEQAMERQAYSAAVIRPRIAGQLKKYLRPLDRTRLKARPVRLDARRVEPGDIERLLAALGLKAPGALRGAARGGRREAMRLLRLFIREKLSRYESDRNDPNLDATSRLSPYLHFGQISPLEIAIEVNKFTGQGSKLKASGARAFLEELIVRRELAMNFAYYNPAYDSYEGIPGWAGKTLASHSQDRREYAYTRSRLERAGTHDPYWNAAQREMVLTGRMHGYMRMYWGKKVIEWSRTPDEAFRTLVYLNDKYELDGRDPNGYAGISWCFGTHDRPWAGREIFGGVRYMNDSGLRRKFDADAYADRISALWESMPR